MSESTTEVSGGGAISDEAEPRKVIEDAFDAMVEIDGWAVSGWLLRNANVVRAFLNQEANAEEVIPQVDDS